MAIGSADGALSKELSDGVKDVSWGESGSMKGAILSVEDKRE
jgi:hypothetical protein